MNTAVPSYLINAELVLRAFGRWPSFHDGYLRSFERRGDAFECEIHGWNMTSKVDARGFFVLERHHRVTFRFSGISDADLEGLEEYEKSFGMNILADVRFSEREPSSPEGAFEVHFDSVVGSEFCGWLRARHGEVVLVQACDSKGNLPDPAQTGAAEEKD